MSPTTEISPKHPRIGDQYFSGARPARRPRVETAWSRIVEVDDGAWKNVLRRVAGLADLPHDWDSYGSDAPAARTLELVLSLLDSARELGASAPSVAPAPAGAVSLVWSAADRTLELLIDESLSGEYLRIAPEREPNEGPLRDATDLRRQIRWFIGNE